MTLRHYPSERPATSRVLLLHGLGGGHNLWDPFLTHRPSDMAVFAAELPWSREGVEWATVPDQEAVIADALEAVAPLDVVVAHSYAANLLLEAVVSETLAGRDPGRRHGLSGMVLVAPFYRSCPEHFEWAEMPRNVERLLHAMDEGIRIQAGERLDEETRLAMAERLCERIGPYGWMRFFAVYLATPFLRAEVISVPTLVVTGDRDRCAVPQEGAALAARIPRSTLAALPSAGHFPMFEDPVSFTETVEKFLSRKGSPRP